MTTQPDTHLTLEGRLLPLWTVEITGTTSATRRYVAPGATMDDAQESALAYDRTMGPAARTGEPDHLVTVTQGLPSLTLAHLGISAWWDRRALTESAVRDLLPGVQLSTLGLHLPTPCGICAHAGVTGAPGRAGWRWAVPGSGMSVPDCGSHNGQDVAAALTSPPVMALGALAAAVDDVTGGCAVPDAVTDQVDGEAECGVCGDRAVWRIATGQCATAVAVCGHRHPHSDYVHAVGAALAGCPCRDCADARASR